MGWSLRSYVHIAHNGVASGWLPIMAVGSFGLRHHSPPQTNFLLVSIIGKIFSDANSLCDMRKP